jgi:hypothetical protein
MANAFKYFFWVGEWGCVDIKKIAWIKCNIVCLYKKKWCLRIQWSKEFNMRLLLGKWYWRLMKEWSSL